MEVSARTNTPFSTRNGRPAFGRVARIADRAANKSADVAEPVPDWLWLSEQCETLKETRQTQPKPVADARQYVLGHPWKALGFAFAAGLFISHFNR